MQCPEDVPSPLPVFLLACDPPEVEEALHGLWPQKIMRILHDIGMMSMGHSEQFCSWLLEDVATVHHRYNCIKPCGGCMLVHGLPVKIGLVEHCAGWVGNSRPSKRFSANEVMAGNVVPGAEAASAVAQGCNVTSKSPQFNPTCRADASRGARENNAYPAAMVLAKGMCHTT